MAGYAVLVRIGRVDPHLLVRGADRPRDDDLEAWAAPVDIVERVPVGSRADRLADIRERWNQMTFFLFDAESWRT